MERPFTCKEAFTLATLSTISVKTDTMDFTGNSLIAVTAAGTILGTYVSEDMKKTLANDTSYLLFENISSLAQEHGSDTSSAILLKDAVLTTSQGIKNTFNFLYLFVEDILALSFGNCAPN